MSSPRVLILLRHGKSAYPEAVGDHERPLAARGQREAALAGEWLRGSQPPVDAVLCSTSLRTRQTLAATGIVAPTRFESSLYGAEPLEVIEEVARTDSAVRTLLVVGHVPGIPATALQLDTDEGELADRLAAKFPTSALAVLSVPGEWSELAATGATLADFHIPR